MFCEKCGASVDDGQPFCPNCGNRLGDASVSAATRASAAPAASLSFRDVLGKISAMQGNAKLFYAGTGGLFIVCFLLSLLNVFYASAYGYTVGVQHLAFGSNLLAHLITVLFTLSITFFVLDLFEKFTFKWLWFFIAGSAVAILLMFIITWINAGKLSYALSAYGWLFFLLQIGLTALSVLNLLEKR